MRESMMQSERGGAMVETALSMLVIVPVFMLGILADDLLRYRLDLQEAVTSTVWDFTGRDFHRGQNHRDVIQRNNRLTWCNHTSAYDSFDEANDCQGTRENEAVGAHVSWETADANEITCDLDEDFLQPGMIEDPTQYARLFHGEYTTGGLATCRASLSVLNYLAPRTFLPQFSDQDLTEKDRHEGDVRAAAGNASGDNGSFFLREQQFAVLTDTWALNDVPWRVYNHQEGDLHERVTYLWRENTIPFLMVGGAISLFLSQVSFQNEFLSPLIGSAAITMFTPDFDLAGTFGYDNPLVPKVAEIHDSPFEVKMTQARFPAGVTREGKYHSVPWQDFQDDNYRQTHEARGDNYMGNTNAERRQQ
jgi:hypothetical protein